jgi:hypothetical protein
VLPAIVEIVEIIDRGLAWPQHIAQPHLGGVAARFGSPVLVRRQAVSALVDSELPEVVILQTLNCRVALLKIVNEIIRTVFVIK